MSDGKIVIDAWFSEYPFPHFAETLERRATEFERLHPEYQVNIRTCYWQTLPIEVAQAALMGRPPTIASYYSASVQQALDALNQQGRPLFTSVDKAVAGRTRILGQPVVLHDLVNVARSCYTLDGDLSSMPFTLSTMLLYSNMTALTEAGVYRVPRTWAEVDSACRAVARRGGPHGITWANDGKFFQVALAQHAGIFADGNNGRRGPATTVDLATPEMMAFVDWWRRLHKDGHYLDTGRLQDWEGTFAAFAEQRAVFRLSSSFESEYMVQAGRAGGFEVAVSPVPFNAESAYAGNWIGGDSIWLAAELDEAVQDGALAFMQFLNSPRNAAAYHRDYGSTPVTYAAIEHLDKEGWFDAHPHHRVATEQLEMTSGAATQAVLGPFAQIQRLMMRAMEDVLARDADARARFTAATAEAQDVLDDYNAHCRDTGYRSPFCMIIDS